MLRATHVVVLILAGVCLSGCAKAVKWLADTQDAGITNSTSMFDRGIDKPEERSLQGLLPCGGDDKEMPGSTGTAADAGFLRLEHTSRCDPWNGDKAKHLVKAGVALSDQICIRWFNDVANAQSALQYSKDALGPIGTITAAILGFTGVPATTIGLTATGFTFAQDSVSAVEKDYIFAPDIPVVWRAVRDKRSEWYETKIKDAAVPDYFEARRILMGYNHFCTQVGVREFITAKLNGADSTKDVGAPLYDGAVSALLSEVMEATNNPRLTLDQLVAYYAHLTWSNIDPELDKKLKEKASENGLVDANWQLLKLPKVKPGAAAPTEPAKPEALEPGSVKDLHLKFTNAGIKQGLDKRARALVDQLKAILDAEKKAKEAKDGSQTTPPVSQPAGAPMPITPTSAPAPAPANSPSPQGPASDPAIPP